MKFPGKNPVIDVTPKQGEQFVYYIPNVQYGDIHNETGAPENMSMDKPRFRALVESIQEEGLRIPVYGIAVAGKFRTMTGKQRVEALHYLGRDIPMVIHDVHRQLSLIAGGAYVPYARRIWTQEEGQTYFEGEATFTMDHRHVSVVKHRNWRDEVG